MGNDKHKGLIPRIIDHIFDYNKIKSEKFDILTEVRMVELYNENFNDLLKPDNDKVAVQFISN